MNQAKHVLFFGLALSTFAAMTGFPLQAADRQPATASWDNLKTLKPGQEIRVVLNDVKSYQGEFQALSEDGITLRQAASEQTLARQNILRVSSKAQKHRGRNALIGAAVGAAPASVLGQPLITAKETVGTPRPASAPFSPIWARKLCRPWARWPARSSAR